MRKQVTYLGNILCYEIENLNKPVCICFHGMNMTREMYKTDQLQHLLKNYSLVLVDLCGYGDSSIETKNFNMVVFNQLVLKLVKYENIKSCTIVGYCLGGAFALDFAIRNPYFIERLILIETMIYLPKWLWLTLLPGYCSGYRIFQKQIKLFKILECCTKFKNISSSKRIRISSREWNRTVNSFYLKLMNEYEKQNHIKRCQQINCPVNIIYSQASFKNIRKTAQILSQFSFVELHLCQGRGHFLFLDETMNRIVI